MPIRTILATLNTVDRAEQLIRIGCELAAKHDAHLIGLYVIPGPRYYATPAATHAAVDINAEQRNYYESNADKVHEMFEEHVRKEGVRGEWRLLQSQNPSVSGLTTAHGMQADLIIAGQTPTEGFDSFEPEFVENVLMDAGRPMLVVPHEGDFSNIGTHALVAWNASAEAARAVADAVPLLKQAEKATVVWVNADEYEGGNLPGSELGHMLSRHDVNVTTAALSTGKWDIGDALLTKANDIGADLVVSGAYGHSRLREYLFGGVTRYLLDKMTVPVLMAH
ncbi:MAG: universal stress protein [Pseudomonadota bacterium]